MTLEKISDKPEVYLSLSVLILVISQEYLKIVNLQNHLTFLG